MTVRSAVLWFVALLAAPVWAQADGPPEVMDETAADAPAVDPALVGQWSLDAVDDPGTMGRFGASLASMACVFGADGQATLHIVLEQDGERYDRERTFGVQVSDGVITSRDQPVGTYEALGDGRVRLAFPDGLVVQMQRVR